MNARSVFNALLAVGGFIVFPASAQEGTSPTGASLDHSSSFLTPTSASLAPTSASLAPTSLSLPPTLKTAPERTSAQVDVARIFEKAFALSRPAIVRVVGNDRHGSLVGTGFFVDAMGTLVTAQSVVGNEKEVRIVLPTNGDTSVAPQNLSARVLATDARSGLAVLKVEEIKTTPFLRSGKSAALVAGMPVLSLGCPPEKAFAPSVGLVEGFEIKNQGGFFHTSHIRVTLPAQPGYAGAPLLNLSGEAVGILLSGVAGTCHALPIEAVNKVLGDVARHGSSQPGWVGITVEILADGNLAVSGVEESSPAHTAGIKPTDKLTAIGERKISKMEDVLDAVFFLSEGDTVNLAVVRGSDTLSLPLVVSKRPAPTVQNSISIEFNLLGK